MPWGRPRTGRTTFPCPEIQSPPKAGQTVVIEPKFLFRCKDAVGIENTFAVTEMDCEILTGLSDNIICFDRNCMERLYLPGQQFPHSDLHRKKQQDLDGDQDYDDDLKQLGPFVRYLAVKHVIDP